MFAEDAHEMITRIIEQAKERNEEIDVEDGFDLYRKLATVRRIFSSALPEYEVPNFCHVRNVLISVRVPFPFHVETLLEEFVWRWLRLTDKSVMEWVNQATRQDAFIVRADQMNDMASEDARHSVSAIDIFRSFNKVVEDLVHLEWDDDFQYAKFMTALSSSISKGVAKYCETLEQIFSREMDRLTPDQEAALNQTTQEKLMQFAKDTWTSKEKIEPFQFSSEVRTHRLIVIFRSNSLVVFGEIEQCRVCSLPIGRIGA